MHLLENTIFFYEEEISSTEFLNRVISERISVNILRWMRNVYKEELSNKDMELFTKYSQVFYENEQRL